MARARRGFVWRGVDGGGVLREGEIEEVSAAMARARLARDGIAVRRVRRAPRLRRRGRRVRPADIAALMRQMATVMHAGIPLVQAFDLMADAADSKRLRGLIDAVRTDVAGGYSLAAALRRQPGHFDALLCNLVDAGEQSGALDAMLERIATYLEKTRATRTRARRALTYPAVVIAVAVAVTALLLVKVVPQFEDLFAGFGAELPAATRAVIAVSERFREWWPPATAAAAALGAGAAWCRRRSAAFRRAIDRSMLKLPVIGGIVRHACVARVIRTLATTFRAGVPLVEALTLVAEAAGNAVFTHAVNEMRDEVAMGQSLNQAMRETGAFPALATRMVAVGEESGALDDMLGRCAAHYEELVDEAVEQLTTLLEPFVMIVLGLVVGGLITAMYLPIFQIGGVIGP